MVPSFQAYLPWGFLVVSCTHSFLMTSHTQCPHPHPEGPIVQLRIIWKWVLAEIIREVFTFCGCGLPNVGRTGRSQNSIPAPPPRSKVQVDEDAPVSQCYFCSLPWSSILWPVRRGPLSIVLLFLTLALPILDVPPPAATVSSPPSRFRLPEGLRSSQSHCPRMLAMPQPP